MLRWADEIRRLGVRANADTPADALKALEHGAEGIGLCRTEHMFMAADRQPKMRAMIMARTEPERRAALAELLPLQQQDFEGLFAAMPGQADHDPPARPAAARVPARPRRARPARPAAPATSARRSCAALEQELELVLRLGEVNPMLGTRGCRLGIVHPEIYEMQVEAIMRAARAADRAAAAGDHDPARRLRGRAGRAARAWSSAIGERHGLREGEDYLVGTMIELPRACFIADRLAAEAAFFSFGTNDLTQTALGFSRDDVEAGFVPSLPRAPDPRPLAVRVDRRRRRRRAGRDSPSRCGRAQREGIELGVCGEHGGDPDSIAFFHRAGLDYVSCSPYRLPIARVAAAQAALAALMLEIVERRRRCRWPASTPCCPRPRRRRCIDAERLGPAELAGRRIWNVNSTARGGGVAEMLGPLLAYARGSGVDARWAVIGGDAPFFAVTKRLHNRLHGMRRATAARSATPSARPTRRRSRRTRATCSRCSSPATSSSCTTRRPPG